jgi:hypothetical protein
MISSNNLFFVNIIFFREKDFFLLDYNQRRTGEEKKKREIEYKRTKERMEKIFYSCLYLKAKINNITKSRHIAQNQTDTSPYFVFLQFFFSKDILYSTFIKERRKKKVPGTRSKEIIKNMIAR